MFAINCELLLTKLGKFILSKRHVHHSNFAKGIQGHERLKTFFATTPIAGKLRVLGPLDLNVFTRWRYDMFQRF